MKEEVATSTIKYESRPQQNVWTTIERLEGGVSFEEIEGNNENLVLLQFQGNDNAIDHCVPK
jgi:hypothetical protein